MKKIEAKALAPEKSKLVIEYNTNFIKFRKSKFCNGFLVC